MPCYHPLSAWQSDSGYVQFFEGGSRKASRPLFLPCGQCVGCRLERSRQWAVRCMHEASLHDENCFLTLTYAPEHLPENGSLVYRHFQLFMKRLRKEFSGRTIRFYMCGEYGEYGRPHYHACIFGINFLDRKHWKRAGSGEELYTSELLSRLWRFGHAVIGDVTFQSAAYVARYCMKKLTGDGSEVQEILDVDTGEIVRRPKEFSRMSLRDAIGKNWLRLYWKDVYPSGTVLVRGVECKAPRYYDKVCKELSAFDDAVYKRYLENRKRSKDNTDERLRVREEVTVARLAALQRNLT